MRLPGVHWPHGCLRGRGRNSRTLQRAGVALIRVWLGGVPGQQTQAPKRCRSCRVAASRGRGEARQHQPTLMEGAHPNMPRSHATCALSVLALPLVFLALTAFQEPRRVWFSSPAPLQRLYSAAAHLSLSPRPRLPDAQRRSRGCIIVAAGSTLQAASFAPLCAGPLICSLSGCGLWIARALAPWDNPRAVVRISLRCTQICAARRRPCHSCDFVVRTIVSLP